MSDRASATIVIGGTLTDDLIPNFLKKLENDHCLLDWEGTPVDLIAPCEGKSLNLCAYDLPGGFFDAVEPFCEFHRLPFVRISGGCVGVFGPERAVFTGADHTLYFELNETEKVVVTLSDIRRLESLEAIEGFFASADFTPPPFQIIPSLAAPAETHNG